MSFRDKEIQRLVSYAQGLGVKVKITYVPKGSKNLDSGYWSTDGSEIEIIVKINESKTSLILSLIHELGHHLWFVYKKSRKPDLSFNKALEIDARSGVTPKNIRKKILSVEKEGTKYWDVIITDTNIKLPKWKVEANKFFDIWQYEFYYEHGTFPKRKERSFKYKELTEKYKKLLLDSKDETVLGL